MKKFTFILAAALTSLASFAQEEKKSTPLEISGSVDTYFKYDFAKNENIATSFATDQNSLSLGMIDVVLKKTMGKTSFVGELSFGPRGQNQSIPTDGLSFASNTSSDNGMSFNIQNLYVSYAATDKLTLTAGYMATFVGYEVISPLANFHYSTSYLFTNGPFQNAGIKANYAISSKVGLMAGVFNNNWNVYSANPSRGLNLFGAQLSLAPTEKISAYLNFLKGYEAGTILDLTASFKLTKELKLGVNAADFTNSSDEGYSGVALYPSIAFNDNFSLGVRAEYFKAKEDNSIALSKVIAKESVTAFTLSANLKSGGLTFIPEVRFDNGSSEQFFKDNGDVTKSSAQATLALVYGF